MNNEQLLPLIELFAATGQAHHAAYAATDGADPEWAIWYADYLYDKLPAHLGIQLERREIADRLTRLAQQHQSEAPGTDWKAFYAQALLRD